MKATSALAAALAVAAIALVPVRPAGAAPATGEPVEIPVVLTQTGTAAFLGTEQAQALALIEADVNQKGGIRGRPLKFHIYDEQSNPTVAVQLVSQILASSSKPAVLIGPVLQASCNATAPLLKNGPVAFCLAPSDMPETGGYRFSANASNEDEVAVMLRYLRVRGLKRIGLITATDAAGQVIAKSFATALADPANKDVVVADHEYFSYGDISVAAQMARIKAAEPQVVIGWATGTPAATLLRGYQDAGLDVPFVAGSGSMVYTQMEQYKSIMPRELLFAGVPQALLSADPGGATSREPVRRQQAAYGEAFAAINVRPDFAQVLIWDTALLAVDTLRHIGPGGTAQQARDYVTSLHDWPGVNGTYDFTNGKQRGVGMNAVAVDRWDIARGIFVATSGPGGGSLR